MLSSLLANWKTTAAGLAAVLTAAGHLLHALASGDTSTLGTDIPALLAGVGLIFAHDTTPKP